MVVNTLGLYGHAMYTHPVDTSVVGLIVFTVVGRQVHHARRMCIRGSGRCYVLDITLYLLQVIGINNELEIYNTSYLVSCISS